jgi:hypothetical protein
MGVGTLSLDRPARTRPIAEVSTKNVSKSRFTKCIAAGWAVATVPYLYVLWGLWSGIDPLRSVAPSDFYDLQARAITHEKLNLKPNSLGIEAFFHDGHTYTYFGIFPSLIRIPVLELFPSLQGKLTAPSMLLAWVITALFSSLLIWRLRIILRGNAVMGWAEAASYGVLIATICAGSILEYLAANPWVYNEDLAWSVALCTATLFVLLGVLEAPSGRRIVISSIFILMADLNRLTTGWACVIAGFLVTGWLAFGRGGRKQRRWAVPMAVATLVPFVIGGLVTTLKFGGPFSLPLADQKWTEVNAWRRYFLAKNGGKGYGIQFLPTTLWTYLQPFGLRLSTIFPFITMPSSPPEVIGNAVFDQWERTASIPASMPLLTLLSVWGTVVAFWPRSVGRIRLTRTLLFGAATATGGVLLWGYISNRYVADFMPFLILAAAIGLVDLWGRVPVRRRRRRRLWLSGGIVVLGVFSLVANAGIALESLDSWSSSQALQFVQAQKELSITSLAATVVHGSSLPYWAPTGELFDVDNCSAFYLSDGYQYTNVPGQNLQHEVWIPIGEGSGITHLIGLTLSQPIGDLHGEIPIFRWGKAVVVLQPVSGNKARIVINNPSPGPSWPKAISNPVTFLPRKHYVLSVEADPYLNSLRVGYLRVGKSSLKSLKSDSTQLSNIALGARGQVLSRYEGGDASEQVIASSQPGITFRHLPTPRQPGLALCRSLQDSK